MIELSNVSMKRDGREILNIEHLSIESDKFTVILGHNGSGKSTLLNLLARQVDPDKGSISYNGQAIKKLSQKKLAQEVAFLPQQQPQVAGMNVRELVRLGRFPWRGTFGRWQQKDAQIIQAAMEQTDVDQYADHMTDNLSGGEQQRAWIAMLLAQQSPILMLDEPTSALDLSHQYELMNLLRQLNQQSGRGIIAILHDINLAARYADRVIALKQGKLCFDGSPSTLLNHSTLTELYGIRIQLIDHPTLDQPVAVVA